ncbi:MAG: zinc-binding dehydrogenase, partial [Armatimonadetes bacterium]|nr:zinc-binding dehydrogenase [Armatimonadota bacterium]
MISGYRAVLQAPRKLELEPREFPDPGPGELLLETEVTLISTGTELTAYSGDFPPDSVWSHYIQYPVGIGYSHVGRVVQVGEDVEGYAPGERVLSMGAHATHALSSGKQVWRVPDGVEATDATFGVLAEIVMGGLRRGRIQFGESVVIVGAGLLGQLAAHFCSRIGAWPVVTVDPVPGVRQESAARMGAGAVLACTAVEARERVEALTRGRMADVVIEVTGNPHAFPGAVRLARRLGR